jgi:IS1 family transposase
MNCPVCKRKAVKRGLTERRTQRYLCRNCKRTFSDHLENSRVPIDKALLVQAGERCERFLEDRIQNVSVKDVQADEIWAFVRMKEKRKVRKEIEDDRIGDAYTFVAIERHTKLVLAWHLGRRTYPDTFEFTEKLYRATGTHYQLTTDGFKAYQNAVIHSLGARNVDFAQLVKVYAHPNPDEHNYSPPKVINSVPVEIYGQPDPDRICTSHVERSNLTMRMQMRRFTRLTNGFSKKWENLKAMLALFFAWYNFVRVHSTIRVTPAMESGLTGHVWTLKELLAA